MLRLLDLKLALPVWALEIQLRRLAGVQTSGCGADREPFVLLCVPRLLKMDT